MGAITLETVTARAQNVEHLLKHGFRVKEAKQEAKLLYQDGIQLILAYHHHKPLFKETVSPVAIQLDRVVGLDIIQGHVSLHRAISKAYRVFIELTLHQYLNKKEVPTLAETKESMLQHAGRFAKNLSKSSVAVGFEYACAEEAARCLTADRGTWEKYISSGAKAIGAAVAGSYGEVATNLLDFLKAAHKDWVAGWYPDMYGLHWDSALVWTQKDFETHLSSRLARYVKEGEEYTLCFAVIFKELVQRERAEPALRDLACERLINLLNLEDNDTLPAIFDHLPTKTLKGIAIKIDKYHRTRLAVLKFIGTLIKKEKYKAYQQKGLQALQAYSTKPRYEDRKKELESHLKNLIDDVNKSTNREEELEDLLAVLRGKSRAGEDPTRLEKAELEYGEIQRKKENCEELIALQKKLTDLEAQEKKQFDEVLKSSK